MNSEICECGKKRDKLNKTNWTRHVNSCTSKKRKILSNNSNIAKFFKTTTSVKDQNPTCHQNEALNSQLLPENNLSTCISDYTENTDGVCEEMSNSLSTSLLFSQSPMLISKSPIKLTKEQNPTCHQNEALNSQLLPENNLSTCTSDNTKNTEMAFKNDPAGIPDSISHELLHYYVNLGPCQPSPLELPLGMFPKKRDWNGMNRSFNESFYNYSKIIPNNPPRRFWLSYSPSEDRIYCISCKLFGLPKAKKSNLASQGFGDWCNLSRKIAVHEHSPEHLQSEISRGLFIKSNRVNVDVQLTQYANRQVADNREVVRAIVEVLHFAARQNIPLRGHSECQSSLNRGNFIEMLKVIAHHNIPLTVHLEKVNKMKKNRLTFMSHESQDQLLCIMSEIVHSTILKNMKKAGLFSVIIDTTTDVSNQEQFSFVVRFVNENGKIEERLLALEIANDGTGHGLFDLFCTITSKYCIDWKKNLCAQAYDGAAAMQGIYSGLRTLIQQQNPKAIYVWCFAHLLNLVVVDTCDSCVDTKNFLGDVQALVFFMKARKRTSVFVECQKKLYNNKRVQRMKSFSDTRWTSHDRVLTVIFEKYQALVESLKLLSNSADRVTASTSRTFLNTISEFKFILCLIFFKNIFNVTTPLSNYLQSRNIDFIEALNLVNITKENLKKLRSDDSFDDFLKTTKEYGKVNKVINCDFKEVRRRTKKKMAGENTVDEIQDSVCHNYKINTYYAALDQIITSINERFSQAKEIMKDLALLNPDRLLCKSQKLPLDSFEHIAPWIGVDESQLRTEYMQMKNNISQLLNGMKLSSELHASNLNMDVENEILSSTEEEISDDETSEKDNVAAKISVTTIIELLFSYDLVSAFPNIYKAYKALATIPPSSATAERSFSKVKLIKTRLRSTMGQTRLESLMLLSCEKDIHVDMNEVIDTYARSSELIQKSLLFK